VVEKSGSASHKLSAAHASLQFRESAAPAASPHSHPMTPSDQTPKLPTWIFIVADLAFISLAAIIAWKSHRPFSESTTFWIVISLIAGAVFGLVPIVAHYERVKNETLDDRQRALEALSRTITSSAEQISIAANGLHEIAELSLKNLRHAEQLPQKLQEKISEFQAALATSHDAEKEELEKELVALRTTESERLESISDKISRSAADWAKLESATQKNLIASREIVERAASDALTQLTAATSATTAAVALAATAAASSLAQASEKASQMITSAAADADRSLAQAQARATGDLEEKLAGVSRAITAATADALAALETKIAALEAAAKVTPAPVFILPPPASIVSDPAPDEPIVPVAVEAAEKSVAPMEVTAHPPKRPRKPRREQSAAEESAAPGLETAETPTPVVLPVPVEERPSIAVDEPAPIPVESIPEITPVIPETADPFVENTANAPIAEPAPAPETAPERVSTSPSAEETPAEGAPAPEPTPVEAGAPAPASAPVAEPVVDSPAAEPARPEPVESEPVDEASPGSALERTAKTSEPELDSEPGLGLEIDDTPAPQSAELAERTLTSDGATRLIVTAYIGIGNRLFIRGEGPGLSWEKGVPLQFVSIGKWRWETSDAMAPLNFKLYKNDTVECTALGSQNLDPGHQQELTASF
jgi:hypothetical protein